jgi:hypothetical protein
MSPQVAKLSAEKLAIIHDYAANFMTMNDEKADQLAQRVMALDDQSPPSSIQ